MRVLMGTSVLLMAAGCTDRHPPPKLIVSSNTVLPEAIPYGGKDIELPIANHGIGELRIAQVTTSCSCAAAAGTEKIQPGGNGKLTVRLQKARPGVNSARLLVHSNDPQSPHEVFLAWYGASIPALDPPVITISDAPVGARILRKFRVTYASGDREFPVEVRSQDVELAGFTVKRIESRPIFSYGTPAMNRKSVIGAELFELSGSLPLEPGTIEGVCTVVIRQAGQDFSLPLPIRIDVLPTFSHRGSLAFSLTPSESMVGLHRSILLLAAGATRAPTVLEAPDFIACRIQDVTSTAGASANVDVRRFLLDVTFTGSSPGDEFAGEVVLHVGDLDAEPHSIPVTVRRIRQVAAR